MGRAFDHADAAADLADAFGEQRLNRRALFHAGRKLMRIAGKADRPLPGDEKLNELGVAAVKLDLIERDSFCYIDCLLIAFILSFRQS